MSCLTVCDCNTSMNNTGTACTPLFQVTKKVILVPYYDSTGTKNSLDLTATLTQSTFTALINQTDSSKRWYPLPQVKNVSDKRGDPIVQKFNDDSTIFIRSGIRNFESIISGKQAAPILIAQIEAARCNDLGVYLVDRLGDIIGIVSDDGTKLYPIRLDSDSVSATLINTTDTEAQAISLRFTFHPDESDACLGMLQISDLGDAKPLDFAGLLDVLMTVSGITTTGCTVKLYTKYGSAKNPFTVKGMCPGASAAAAISTVTGTASKVRDTTASADVSVSSMTESTTTPGTYVMVWTSITSAHVVNLKFTYTGYDFSGIVSTAVTIP